MSRAIPLLPIHSYMARRKTNLILPLRNNMDEISLQWPGWTILGSIYGRGQGRLFPLLNT